MYITPFGRARAHWLAAR